MLNTNIVKHILITLLTIFITPFLSIYALIIDYKQFAFLREMWNYVLHPNEF